MSPPRLPEAPKPSGDTADTAGTGTKTPPVGPVPALTGAADNGNRDDPAAAKDSGEVIEARPLYRDNPAPTYPPAARQRHYEGRVLLEVLVDRRGRVEELQVAESSGHPMLDRAAASTVAGWRFEPGRRGDQPVATTVMVPIRFNLQ